MNYEIKQDGKFKFIEEGTGEPLVLLHGLFGALSNFEGLINYFVKHNKVIVPMLPLFELDGPQAMTDPLVEVAEDAGRVGELEVVLPPDEVPAQLIDHRR